jgi:diketogulonate reductase-like aldo/keto reductase
MLPIPGTSSVAHLEENLKANEILLSDAELNEIEKAARSCSSTSLSDFQVRIREFLCGSKRLLDCFIGLN